MLQAKLKFQNMSNLSFPVLKFPFGLILISSEDDDDGDQVFVVVANAELKSIQAFEKLKSWKRTKASRRSSP